MYKKNILKYLIILTFGIFLAFNYFFPSSQNNQSNNTKTSGHIDDRQVLPISILPKSAYKKTGNVKIIDGDSLSYSTMGNHVRMFAIDSPELAQECTKSYEIWYCGRAAKQALTKKIADKTVTCLGDEKDKHGRLIATCYLHINGTGHYLDLNAWMVKNGWAIAYEYYSKRYVSEQNYAKTYHLGIWQSSFIEPFKWRQKNVRR